MTSASVPCLQIGIKHEGPEEEHLLRVTWRNGAHHATLCADLRTFAFDVIASAIADAGQEHTTRCSCFAGARCCSDAQESLLADMRTLMSHTLIADPVESSVQNSSVQGHEHHVTVETLPAGTSWRMTLCRGAGRPTTRRMSFPQISCRGCAPTSSSTWTSLPTRGALRLERCVILKHAWWRSKRIAGRRCYSCGFTRWRAAA